jgi:hypothetical protein
VAGGGWWVVGGGWWVIDSSFRVAFRTVTFAEFWQEPHA